MKNRTPLHIATDKDRREIAELLISKGADLNAKTYAIFDDFGHRINYRDATPLHIAAYKNLKEMGELLLLKGADINALNIHNHNIII